MSSKAEAILKPWCPFCGMDVGRPTFGAQRKMREFAQGVCECGAVYVCDATGHTIGAAMVECLVTACNDQWDLAWELLNNIPGVSCVKPKGSLYMFPKLDPKVYPIKDDQKMVFDLLQQEKMLIVQGTGFNWPAPDHFRIVFLPPEEQLQDAMTRLARFLKTYKQ